LTNIKELANTRPAQASAPFQVNLDETAFELVSLRGHSIPLAALRQAQQAIEVFPDGMLAVWACSAGKPMIQIIRLTRCLPHELRPTPCLSASIRAM
jgi:hypothetical protein